MVGQQTWSPVGHVGPNVTVGVNGHHGFADGWVTVVVFAQLVRVVQAGSSGQFMRPEVSVTVEYEQLLGEGQTAPVAVIVVVAVPQPVWHVLHWFVVRVAVVAHTLAGMTVEVSRMQSGAGPHGVGCSAQGTISVM